MKCGSCNQEMMDGVSCTLTRYSGEEYDRVPNGDEPCGDCKAPPEGMHHPGCCRERCSSCGRQSMTCECNRDDEEDCPECGADYNYCECE